MSTNLSITLPRSLATFVETQAIQEGYGTADAYVLALILEARRAKARARLEAMLLEGLDSGPAVDATDDDYWEAKLLELERKVSSEVGT